MNIRLLWLLGLLFFSGCGPAVQRADLVFINGAEPETLDPAILTGQPEGRLANALFEGLTTFNSAGKPGPGMAESWTVSDDKRVYTFSLRPGAVWSDGKPVTAHDFVASWKRTLTPATAASYNYQLFYIRNAQAFAEGRTADFAEVGVRALDDRTLEVTLENPTSFFLDLCATPPLAPVPVEVIAQWGDDWIKPGRIVTNGAYELESWRINDKIRLRKNPRYWNARNVALETIDVLPIEKDMVAFNFYESGLADLVMDKGLTPLALLGDLRKRRDFHAAPFLGTYFLRFNCQKGPFADERVRRAFAMAVDRQRIVEKITRAGETPAVQGFVPPGIAGYVSPEGLPYDPEGARRLLAEAGYPGGQGFPFVTYLFDDKRSNEAIAVELQDMWQSELGVSVNLARQEWKVYLNSLNGLDYDIARSSWVGDYPDPNTFLDMFLTGGGNNRTGWSDPHYEQFIADAARETDPARRFAILQEAENLLINQAVPICPIYFYVGIQLYNPDKIGGIEPNVLDEHPLKAMFRKSP
ncbi:MAG TPA: peptide ABC transporter substrate-binding protein [Terrimicrobiaceae bacterium]|nr:peptide ABC transporter substrate-binding protein [Terrimicrobiaceae bacterium]